MQYYSILKAKLFHEDYSESLLLQDADINTTPILWKRIVIKDEILTRQYIDETGNVKYHQILLPQHLLQELLQSLHETAHKHPGISKMLQEIRQRYYYPRMAKYVRKWVEGCEQCARDQRALTQELRLNCSTCRNGTLDPRTPCKSTDCRIFPQVEGMRMS